MEPPFPGMDPYLEAPSLWPDVHNRLAFAICDQLQPQIGPRYIAAIVPYATFETIDIAPARKIVPDIGILERDSLAFSPSVGVVIADAPLTTTIALDFPTRYASIEIRAVGDETLVTAIEILSPVNKRPGAEGADAYERKRREIFRSEAHLIEIDLLRAGKRPTFRTTLPDYPYFIFLSRSERRPVIDIWPLPLADAIPAVPVPLLRPDPDARLELGAALRYAYASARYDLRIDYRVAPSLPDLVDADAVWLDERLHTYGLR
jgi:Protein of unknown function (DUF4058)